MSGVDLSVASGSLFSLLGPSGCGKSTLLRIIAGFEKPGAGEVFIGGRPMRGVPPERRGVGVVFQNYALFPNMTVADNIGFGLQVRRLPAQAIRGQVDRMIELTELSGLAGRKPAQLSGGQQQRVALARALAIEPQLLLLDEPLAALDRKLRESLRTKLVDVQRALRVTTVFVRHDQEEALTMSDRIAVMSGERHGVEQVGTPRKNYDRPASPRISDFIGRTNRWRERVCSVDASGVATTARGFRATVPNGVSAEGEGMLCLRPERIRMFRPGGATGPLVNVIAGRVRTTVFAGETRMVLVESDFGEIIEVRELNDGNFNALAAGDELTLTWSEADMLVLV